VQPSRIPLWLALATFVLALISGGYAYTRYLRTVPALTAVRDIPAGTALAADMVREVRMPAGGVPPQSLYGLGQVAGMYASAPIFADQILTNRHVTDAAPADVALSPPGQGMRVISLPVRPETALGGALKAGETVDVAVAWPTSDGRPAPVEVLAAGVKVVDLRTESGLSATKGGVPATALLQVTTQQARTLVAAVESKGVIYLWLTGREHS